MDNIHSCSSISQNHTGTGHNVAGNLIIYNSDNVDYATELAIAVLVGCWDEKNNGDIDIITSLIGES